MRPVSLWIFLMTSKTPRRPTENAQAGDPPWFDADQRERLANQVR